MADPMVAMVAQLLKDTDTILANPIGKMSGVTHSEGCWKWHIECYAARVHEVVMGQEVGDGG